MKHTLFLIAFTVLCFCLSAQSGAEKPILSKHEFGLTGGGTSAAGNGIMLAYNRYLSENHVLRFKVSPLAYGGATGLIGSFDFWNEYRRYIGKSQTLFFSHGLSLHAGDRNRFVAQDEEGVVTTKFVAGVGYGIGLGKVINERLTFWLSAKPSINYVRTKGLSVMHDIKPDVGLSFGVYYRFK